MLLDLQDCWSATTDLGFFLKTPLLDELHALKLMLMKSASPASAPAIPRYSMLAALKLPLLECATGACLALKNVHNLHITCNHMRLTLLCPVDEHEVH